MKKNYLSSPLRRMGIALLIICSAFIVNSCRKNFNQPDDAASHAVDVAKFKAIYNEGIQKRLVLQNVQPGQAVLNLIYSLNVNWTKYSIIHRKDSSVVNEFEMMPDSAFFTLGEVHQGDTLKYNNKPA